MASRPLPVPGDPVLRRKVERTEDGGVRFVRVQQLTREGWRTVRKVEDVDQADALLRQVKR